LLKTALLLIILPLIAARGTPIQLKNDKIFAFQSASNTFLDYILEGVPTGAKVTCHTTGSTGTLGLLVQFDEDEDFN